MNELNFYAFTGTDSGGGDASRGSAVADGSAVRIRRSLSQIGLVVED